MNEIHRSDTGQVEPAKEDSVPNYEVLADSISDQIDVLERIFEDIRSGREVDPAMAIPIAHVALGVMEVTESIRQVVYDIPQKPSPVQKYDLLSCLSKELKQNSYLTREVLPGIVQSLVDDARGSGATWQDIANSLGISTQTAHYRYARKTHQDK